MAQAEPGAGTALVTGVRGQDAGYLCEHLLRDGYAVHGLDRHAGDAVPPWLKGVTLHEVDLCDTTAVHDLVMRIRPDEVYNLAAISSVAACWADPVTCAQVNGVAVAGLLEAAWQLQENLGRPVRVVQASSAEIFGATTQVPQNELTPVAPVNPYGAAKAYAHHLVDVYRQRGLHSGAVVLYGHESVRRPTRFVTRKISSTVAAIAVGEADTLTLGPLDARRDWGWAPEYVDAMIRAARHPEPMDFVLATGQAHSIEEFVAEAFARIGVEDWRSRVTSDAGLARPTNVQLQVGDSSRAAQVLGWTPTVVFPEVVHRMVDADLAALGGSTGGD